MISAHNILSVAIEHVPALLLIWLTIYVAYWLLGILKWPRVLWRDKVLAQMGTVDIPSLAGGYWGSLAVISLISLFLELLLIRWIASEIRVFAYFKSLVLIACFLGFGLGCYLTKKTIRLAHSLVPLLALVFITEIPWDPARRLITNLAGFIGWFSDVHIWNRAYFETSLFWGVVSAGMALSIVIPLFGLIAITFIPMGQLVGWYLENSPKGILAYSVNVIASIIGIWLYTMLCFLSTPPVIWFGILFLGLLVYFWPLVQVRKSIAISFVCILALFALGNQKRQWWGEQSWKGSVSELNRLEVGEAETLWSPYSKLTIVPLKKGDEIVRYILNTNDTWYQQILDLSAAGIVRDPQLLANLAATPLKYHQYNLPYQFYPAPSEVFIAGAGMGNDVAGALRAGAGHVTAVEIDPLIYSKGKQLHFESPYSSDRVEVHIDDARSFVQNTKKKFDLIVFSILDSHTTSSYYTNIRLDNYVYTVEGIEAVKRLLKPDGLFFMSFSVERPWFTKRLLDIITQVFGKPPLLMLQTNAAAFVVDLGNRVETVMAANTELNGYFKRHSAIKLEEAELTTDDWPYLYQQYRGIPVIVWILSIGLVAVCWLTFRKLKESQEGIQWHFFFLGAAFMLIEVQIISKLALLFGTTWLVNSIVISTLLLFILLSNLTVSIFPRFPRSLSYAGLFGALALNYLVPTNALFYESLWVRTVVATGMYCAPVFFAGLIFITSFRQAGFQAEAFGSNLLGALVGGLLESLSFLSGIKALVIVAALLYFLSLVTKSRVRVTATSSAAVTTPA
jgi:SAM-dependent methyltransferase